MKKIQTLNWLITISVSIATVYNIIYSNKLNSETNKLNVKVHELNSEELELKRLKRIKESFDSELESAIARSDKINVERLHKELEKFEEEFRKYQLLATQLKDAKGIGLDEIDDDQKKNILNTYASLGKKRSFISTLDKADLDYLQKDFKSASTNYSSVLKNDPKNREAALYGCKSIKKALAIDSKYKVPKRELLLYKNSINKIKESDMKKPEPKLIAKKRDFQLIAKELNTIEKTRMSKF